MARQARFWLNKDLGFFARKKTLREMMAERGLDEFGRRKTQAAPAERAAPPAAQPAPQAGASARFVASFSYATLGQQTVEIEELNALEFRGRNRQDGRLHSYAWAKIRGLVKIVDSGEMLTPLEVLDRFH